MARQKTEEKDSDGGSDCDLRIPALPVFDNPAYESSDADLDSINNTLNSTKSLRSVSASGYSENSEELGHLHDDNEPENCKNSIEYSCKTPLDPLEDLRNLAREISPGVTAVAMTQSLESQISRLNSRASDITRFPIILTPGELTRSSPSTKKEKMSDCSDIYLGTGSTSPTGYNNFKSAKSITKTKSGKEFGLASGGKTFYGFTLRQWSLLAIFAFVNALSAMCVSLLAPFYPEEAERKNASSTETGFVVGSFELVVFIMSPVFGKYMSRLGTRNVFNYGLVATGVCSVLFGFLTFIHNRFLFIGMSLIIRVIAAVGSSAQVTASFTLIAVEFTDNIFTIFAAMETCTGVGLILGPLVGSVLFKVGGFALPFTALGGFLFIGCFLSFMLIPTTSPNPSELEDDENSGHGQGFFKVMRIPSVALAAFSIAAAAVSLGFNVPTLAPHLDQFQLDEITKGFIFIINGGTYAATAPLWGRICDKTSQQKRMTLLGAMLIFLGFMLIGPASFMPFNTILWVTCLGLFIQGLGLGAAFVSGFTQGMRASIEMGYPENVNTYGLISGMWMSMFALGNFIGPSVAGILMDLVGYRVGSFFVMAVQLLLVGITLVFIQNERKNGNAQVNRDSELEIHDGSGGIAVKEAKFFTNSEFSL